MLERFWKHQIRDTDDLTTRLIVLNVVAVITLYVLASMIAALARLPGQETDGKGEDRYRAEITLSGPQAAREPWEPDFVLSPYRDRVAAAQPSVAAGNLITMKSTINVKVAQLSEPRHSGMVGCIPSTLPPRFKRLPEESTRF